MNPGAVWGGVAWSGGRVRGEGGGRVIRVGPYKDHWEHMADKSRRDGIR